MNNTRPWCITAAAGTSLARPSLPIHVIIFLGERVLQFFTYIFITHALLLDHSVRTLSNIPHCCILKNEGPCLSASVAVTSLKAAKDHRLGKLLPYQQSNLEQTDSLTKPKFFFNDSFNQSKSTFLLYTHPFAILTKKYKN